MSTGRLRMFYTSLPRFVLPGTAAILLLTSLLAIAIMRLIDMPAEETLRANAAHQRIIVDAITGAVSGLGSGEAPAFDVGDTSNTTPPETGSQPSGTEETKPLLAEGLPSLRTTPEATEAPTVARGADSLVKAPAPEAVEKIGSMVLPRKTDKGLEPSRLYSRGFARKEDDQLLAIVITDAGFNNDGLSLLLTLPKELSVAMSPYASQSASTIETLRNAGHEVWSMLPAVSETYPQDDPGPLGLLGTQSAAAAVSRTQQVMALTPGSVGMILPPEETITAYPDVWNPVFAEISGRGLLLLTTRSNRSLDQVVADKSKHDLIHRADIILDSTPSTAFIRSKLSGLQDQMATQGQLVLIASARPQTLSAISDWLKSNPGFTLAPLSAIYRNYEPPPEPVEQKSHGGGH